MYINCKTMRQVSDGNPELTSRYFKDLRKLPKIGQEEQTKLIREYAVSTDEKRKNEIKEQLVLANQLFIVSVARHVSRDDDFNDLISEGNIGLIHAIDTFNAKKDNQFLTYAAHLIRKEMTDYQNNEKRLIKPKNVARVSAYSDSSKNKFFMENGYYPTVEELQDSLEERGIFFSNKEDLYDITVSSIDYGFEDEDNDVAENWFDRYYYTNGYTDLGNSSISEYIESSSVHKMVQRSLSFLNDEEMELVKQYYGIGCRQQTANELAIKRGVQPKCIENRIEKLIKKIRKDGKIQTDIQ